MSCFFFFLRLQLFFYLFPENLKVFQMLLIIFSTFKDSSSLTICDFSHDYIISDCLQKEFLRIWCNATVRKTAVTNNPLYHTNVKNYTEMLLLVKSDGISLPALCLHIFSSRLKTSHHIWLLPLSLTSRHKTCLQESVHSRSIKIVLVETFHGKKIPGMM